MITVIAGDIGGTKTRLALMRVAGTRVETEREQTYRSADFPLFEDLLADFLADMPAGLPCALGIAGSVQGRLARTTNLPWLIDAAALQQRFGLADCRLLNDLEATAHGLPALGEADLLTLQVGAAGQGGNRAIIAAGTGLGEAGLFWGGQAYQPFATEGGHTSFCPQDERGFALLQFLQQRHGHVSWERVVSGMGIVALHDFLRDWHRSPVPAELASAMCQGDAAAAIAGAAQAGDALCAETLDWFVQLYGAEAGNLALKTLSRGGLYVGGGIAPKLLPLLQRGDFIAAFLEKGRMRPLLEAMPVQVILNDRAALFGPALCAARGA